MKALCATVFYTKYIKGKLYPKAARNGTYAYANEVSRVQGKVVSKYVGIVKVPENASVEEKGDEVESTARTDVVDKRRGGRRQQHRRTRIGSPATTPNSGQARWRQRHPSSPPSTGTA